MTDPQQSPDDLDRALARGGVSGPEADAMWASIDATLDAQAGPASPSLWDRVRAWPLGVRLAAGLAPLAAALVFMVVGSKPDGFQPRGPDSSLPHLLATCGSVESPCHVGERVFLKVVGGARDQDVAVQVAGHDDGSLFAGRLGAGETTPLTQALVPEVSDTAAGITVTVRGPAGETQLHLEVRP